jgi:hypothetical protein
VQLTQRPLGGFGGGASSRLAEAALCRVVLLPPCGGPSFTPARRAFDTPYATFPMFFCADQWDMFTMCPRRLATIDRAANWLA